MAKTINEWADIINVNGEVIKYNAMGRKNYPFAYIEDSMHIGSENDSHASIETKFDWRNDINGRVFGNSKIISFWKYPESKDELLHIIFLINNRFDTSGINLNIDNSWTVEIPIEITKKDNGNMAPEDRWNGENKSIFVLIQEYSFDLLDNKTEYMDKLNAQMQQHSVSPMLKSKRSVPPGMGSNKLKGGMSVSQYDMYKPGFGESILKEMINSEVNALLQESVQHKAALDLISSLIKGTEWEGKVFAAGGMVRDELMGKDIKDIDLTVASPNGGIKFAEWLAKKLNIYKQDTNPVIFPRFGTAKITFKGIRYNGHDLSNIDVETVMTRKEKYNDPESRNPDVDYGTLEQDAERRDLTINSLLKDLSTGEIKDLTGKGLKDLKDKVIRTPLDPDIIFREDPLRMLRVIRFTVKYGWKLPLFMIKALKRNANLLGNISAERIQDELNKILITDKPHVGIKLLYITGLNEFIAPEFKKIVGQAQNEFHQWKTDKHTYEVIKNSKPDLIIRLSSWLHDIGKGDTKTEKDGKIHFYGHEDVGANTARKILTRLKYPNEIIDAVVICVKNHMRTKQWGKYAELVSDKALRKFMNDLGNHLDTALEVIHSDNISHGDLSKNWSHNLPDQVQSIKNKIKTLGDFTKKLNIPVNGTDVLRLIKQFDPDFKPGKMIGDILDVIKDKFLENPNITKEEAENIIVSVYKEMHSKNNINEINFKKTMAIGAIVIGGLLNSGAVNAQSADAKDISKNLPSVSKSIESVNSSDSSFYSLIDGEAYAYVYKIKDKIIVYVIDMGYSNESNATSLGGVKSSGYATDAFLKYTSENKIKDKFELKEQTSKSIKQKDNNKIAYCSTTIFDRK